ncbi:MAG: hypothetical protein IPP66_20210 [Anaerolineales bacterium]|nr:hypothetical protein [Anaerolineales bacterium]
MKRFIRPAIILGVSLLIALSSAMITYTAKISGQGYSTTASILLQTTPTPVEEDRSEVGDTDLIVILGGVITAIILIPVLIQRKSWMRME